MEYYFKFSGGVQELAPGVKEKFYLLGIVGEKELFLYQARHAGLVEPVMMTPETVHGVIDRILSESHLYRRDVVAGDWFKTQIRYWKVFNHLSGFGVRKQTYSLVIDLKPLEEVHPIITIHPVSWLDPRWAYRATKNVPVFNQENGESQTVCYPWAYFLGKASIVPRDAAKELLSGESRDFFAKMPPMPLALMRELVRVDRSMIKSTVRAVRFKKPCKAV